MLDTPRGPPAASARSVLSTLFELWNRIHQVLWLPPFTLPSIWEPWMGDMECQECVLQQSYTDGKVGRAVLEQIWSSENYACMEWDYGLLLLFLSMCDQFLTVSAKNLIGGCASSHLKLNWCNLLVDQPYSTKWWQPPVAKESPRSIASKSCYGQSTLCSRHGTVCSTKVLMHSLPIHQLYSAFCNSNV